jgi:hypothetical protein
VSALNGGEKAAGLDRTSDLLSTSSLYPVITLPCPLKSFAVIGMKMSSELCLHLELVKSDEM